jgi:hypothetical protein
MSYRTLLTDAKVMHLVERFFRDLSQRQLNALL